MIQELLSKLSNLFSNYLIPPGRGFSYETLTSGQGVIESESEKDDYDRPEQLSLDPYIFSGIRFRDIGHLWLSARGLDSEDDNECCSPPQIDYPQYAKNKNEDQLRFIQWNFDERLEYKGLGSIIREIQETFIIYGRAICEIDWQREIKGDYAGYVVFNDIIAHDPQRFVINPKGLEPGLYLKPSIYYDTVGSKDRLPDKKFMIITNNRLFGNSYGISEVLLLDNIQKYLEYTLKYYAKGLERNGIGALIGKYGKALTGKGKEDDRKIFYQELKKLSSDTITMMSVENEIHELSTNIADSAFANFIKTAISQISLVLTGSPTALIETEHGTYGMEESKSAREKSLLEQKDAAIISEAFSFQLIPWLIDFNYSSVSEYPCMFLIQPALVQPTISEGQQDLIQQIQNNPKGKDDSNNQKESLKLFQKEESTAENNNEKIEIERYPDFPDNSSPPEIFDEISRKAEDYLKNMPIYLERVYRGLPESEKRNSFTIKRAHRQKDSITVLAALKDLIRKTITETNEAKAWDLYLEEAKKLMRATNSFFTPAELIPSFRITRQKAYNQAILNFEGAYHGDEIYGIQYITKSDERVRSSHRKLHGFLRPINDKIWEGLRPPIDWECRCYLQIITQSQHDQEPEKYSYTKETPSIPKGFST